MIKNMIYTLRHIVALNKTAKRLGAWHWRFLLHDVDKLFCYILFSKETTHKIHRTFSFHHPTVGKIFRPSPNYFGLGVCKGNQTTHARNR